MKLIKKIVLVSLLLATGLVAVKNYYPAAWNKLVTAVSPLEKQVGLVLGDIADNNNLKEPDLPSQLKKIPEQIMASPAFKEITTKINELVVKEVEKRIGEVKDLPEKQVEKVTLEVKRQICEDWLDYKGKNND